jgi:hypothetical protein
MDSMVGCNEAVDLFGPSRCRTSSIAHLARGTGHSTRKPCARVTCQLCASRMHVHRSRTRDSTR